MTEEEEEQVQRYDALHEWSNEEYLGGGDTQVGGNYYVRGDDDRGEVDQGDVVRDFLRSASAATPVPWVTGIPPLNPDAPLDLPGTYQSAPVRRTPFPPYQSSDASSSHIYYNNDDQNEAVHQGMQHVQQQQHESYLPLQREQRMPPTPVQPPASMRAPAQGRARCPPEDACASWDEILASPTFAELDAGIPAARSAHVNDQGEVDQGADVRAFLGGGAGAATPVPPVTPNTPRNPVGPPDPPDASAPMSRPATPLGPAIHKRRPPHKIIQGLDQAAVTALGPSFPVGPIPGTAKELKLEVQRVTQSRHEIGAFDVHLTGGLNSTFNRVKLRCHKAYPPKMTQDNKMKGGTSCKWAVTFEETEHGWVLQHIYSGADLDPSYIFPSNAGVCKHNHELLHQRRSVLANFSTILPDDIWAVGSIMFETGSSVRQVARTLREMAGRASPPIQIGATFYKQCFDRFSPSGIQKDLDFSGLLEVCMLRERNEGLRYFVTTIRDGAIEGLEDDELVHDAGAGSVRCTKLFVELKGAREIWAKTAHENVLLFDPTHGTNRYKMKLCSFTTVDETGQTVVLATALLSSESCAQFDWAFMCFHETFRLAPTVLFTDRDPQLDDAFVRMASRGYWANTAHLFCIFHLSKNLHTHLYRHCARSEDWHRVCNRFWRIAKRTDVRSKDDFDAEWEGLISLFESIARDVPKSNVSDQIAWLKSLGNLRDQWAARFVMRHGTYGIMSTQRTEAVHSSFKRWMAPSMLVTDLIEKLHDYNEESQGLKLLQMLRLIARQVYCTCVVLDVYS
jgi:hypothetical protein